MPVPDALVLTFANTNVVMECEGDGPGYTTYSLDGNEYELSRTDDTHFNKAGVNGCGRLEVMKQADGSWTLRSISDGASPIFTLTSGNFPVGTYTINGGSVTIAARYL